MSFQVSSVFYGRDAPIFKTHSILQRKLIFIYTLSLLYLFSSVLTGNNPIYPQEDLLQRNSEELNNYVEENGIETIFNQDENTNREIASAELLIPEPNEVFSMEELRFFDKKRACISKAKKFLYREFTDADIGNQELFETIVSVLEDASLLLKEQPNIIQLQTTDNAKTHIFSDIHGSIETVIWIIENKGLPSTNNFFVFLGDIVDKGENSLACLLTILTMLNAYPENVIYIRGNHETRGHLNISIPEEMRLHDEIMKYFPTKEIELKNALAKFFTTLPLACVINDNYFCVHGGIPGTAPTFEEINNINRHMIDPERANLANQEYETERKLMVDLLWSDPWLKEYGISEPETTSLHPVRTGGVKVFSQKVTTNFLEKNRMEKIIRGHEIVPGIQENPDTNIITIASGKYIQGNSSGFLSILPGINPINMNLFSVLEENTSVEKRDLPEKPSSLLQDCPEEPLITKLWLRNR